jgi:ABC-type dipeptide/oligopeptide/nickel transport system ATPase subunit
VINLPLLDRLEVNNYGMYPGKYERGINLKVGSGLTLIVGANGLGKTTLVMILYRLLTGPFDVPAFARRELGTAKLEATKLPRDRQLSLSTRVADGAREATGRLTFRIGLASFVVERSLFDLSLRGASINGDPIDLTELALQRWLMAKVGVWSFADFILLLQQLLFYSESRRELVWDPAAQRELLRVLFLSPAEARKWSEDAREILEFDSYVRNLSAIRFRIEADIERQANLIENLPAVRTELSALSKLQDADAERRERLNQEIDSGDAQRFAWRQRKMELSQLREDRYRELERAKLLAITAEFPSQSETARYLLAHLMIEGQCLVCGEMAPREAHLLAERLARRRCVMCGHGLEQRRGGQPSAATLDRLKKGLDKVAVELDDATAQLQLAERYFNEVRQDVLTLNRAILDRSRLIDALIAKLPPEEATLHSKRSELAGWKARESEDRRQIDIKRDAFKSFIDEKNREIVKYAEQIKTAFHAYSEGFLVEDCNLVWQPQRARLGQSGEFFDFPAFELSMTGAGFAEAVRRAGPEQVSESQREFVDLAFRMALIQVAVTGRSGSLVIDAPESSLDIVFSERAVRVLNRFANTHENRLIVTSNLSGGNFIYDLAKTIPVGTRKERILDLFEVAEKTAAVREYWSDYKRARDRLFK